VAFSLRSWFPCSEFCAGAGQLHVFCPRAPELLHRLLTSGRVRRLLASPLPSPPPLRSGARRLSRSESDLHCFVSSDCSPQQYRHFLRRKGVLERSHSSSRTSATSDDYVQAIGGKVRTKITGQCSSNFWQSRATFLPRSFRLGSLIALMMEASRTSETSVDNYFTRQYLPEDKSELHTRRCRENLKSHTFVKFPAPRNACKWIGETLHRL
jgi:hypothetical protein